jgi:hypothetical protein
VQSITAPARTLTATLVLAAVVVVPSVALFALADAHTGNGGEFARFALPAVLGLPVAVALRMALRNVRTRGAAWGIAAFAVALVVAVSVAPVLAVGHLVHLQVQEYQPGGRGYPG